MNRLLKELILLVITAIPIIYISLMWDSLPEKVPVHFNLAGKADNYSSKMEALYLIVGVNLGVYLLMLVVPKLDPKGKVMEMGEKYFSLRLIMQLFMAGIMAYIVYAGLKGKMANPNILFVMIGALMALLGNYFQVLRPNYFIGIKTPWTLENETVWKKTHAMGGKIWVIGGIIMAIAPLILSEMAVFMTMNGIVLAVMVLAPVIYSYRLHQKLKKEAN